jgi:hypothetical protein
MAKPSSPKTWRADLSPQTPEDHDPRGRYLREVFRLYRATPGVLGHIRRADREFASTLFDQGVPLDTVERAFVLAAVRRVRHNAFSTPLPPIRCLHYFRAIIQETQERPLAPQDVEELRRFLLEHPS